MFKEVHEINNLQAGRDAQDDDREHGQTDDARADLLVRPQQLPLALLQHRNVLRQLPERLVHLPHRQRHTLDAPIVGRRFAGRLLRRRPHVESDSPLRAVVPGVCPVDQRDAGRVLRLDGPEVFIVIVVERVVVFPLVIRVPLGRRRPEGELRVAAQVTGVDWRGRPVRDALHDDVELGRAGAGVGEGGALHEGVTSGLEREAAHFGVVKVEAEAAGAWEKHGQRERSHDKARCAHGGRRAKEVSSALGREKDGRATARGSRAAAQGCPLYRNRGAVSTKQSTCHVLAKFNGILTRVQGNTKKIYGLFLKKHGHS